MPDVISRLEEVPLEILDTILGFLPKFSLVGEHSAHKVSYSLNERLKGLHNKSGKLTSKQLVDSILTEEEALHFFDNTKLCDEMNNTWLLRLACKIPRVREALIPKLSYLNHEIDSICEYDIDTVRYAVEQEYHSNYSKAVMRSYHEQLCLEYLKQNTIDIDEAMLLSRKHLEVARKILTTPEISENITITERFNIIYFHTELVKENIPICEAFWNDELPLYSIYSLDQFIAMHGHIPEVADFLFKRFAGDREVPRLIKYTVLLRLAKHHFTIVNEKMTEVDWLFMFTEPGVRTCLDTHFEIAKKFVNKRPGIYIPDYNDNVFYIIMKYFPDSKCFLLDSDYILPSSFYKEYGPVLALPRMQRVLANASATAYDFKFAMAQSLFENPRLFYYLNDKLKSLLAEVIDDLSPDDFSLMKPYIIKIFKNEALRKTLNGFLSLKLIHKIPFELGDYLMDEDYFNTVIVKNQSKASSKAFNWDFILDNPVLMRKIMNNPLRFDSLEEFARINIKESLDKRDLIKQIVDEIKIEKQATLNP